MIEYARSVREEAQFMKKQYLFAIGILALLISCKSPPPISISPPPVEEAREYHDIELICGNASTRIKGDDIVSASLVQEPKSKKKLIVEILLSGEGTKAANSIIKKNLGKELSVITPERLLLVGRVSEELADGTIRISSYSQEVAEEILGLLTKRK